MKIEWKGGECPVYGSVSVKVFLRDGFINAGLAEEFEWDCLNAAADIIAYEVLEESKDEPEKTLRDEFAIAWINGGHQPSYDAYIFADSMMKARAK